MISRQKAKEVMDKRGLEVCDAILILVASSDQTGISRVNQGLKKEQVWKIMNNAMNEIKKKHSGSYNLKDSIAHKMIGVNLLREFGK